MNIRDIQFLFDYHYWTAQLIFEKAAAITPEQLIQPTPFSWESLFKTLVHTLDSDHLWLHLCRDRVVLAPRLIEMESFPTLESVITAWEQLAGEMRAYLNSLTDADMEDIVRYEVPEGIRERVLWHCLVHVVNHGTQHFSECAAMLTDFGQSPGGLDMTRYLNVIAGRGAELPSIQDIKTPRG